MRLINLIVFLFFAFSQAAFGQNNISGYIRDKASGEVIIGANVALVNTPAGTSTNTYGFYSLTILFPSSPIKITISAVGYQSYQAVIEPGRESYSFELSPLTLLLDEVIITSTTDKTANHNQLIIEPQKIKQMPRLVGEADPMKYLQTIPGVKTGREGSAGLYVRGGTPDQNLILLDGVPIYNINHLFGYLSVFNTDAIKNIQLYKSGIPARYEGRLSSVIDIAMKEGNLKEKKQNLSISPIAGTLLIEGPIKEDKSSYMISMRRTWLDALYSLFTIGSGSNRGFNFYDLSAKYQHKFSEKNSLYVSLYGSRDKFYDVYRMGSAGKASYSFNYGNATGLVRYSSQLRSNAFTSTSLYYSRYSYRQQDAYKSPTASQQRKVNSRIEEINLSSTLDYFPHAKHQIKTGVQLSYKSFKPEIIQITGEIASGLSTNDLSTGAFSGSVFVEDLIKLISKLSLDIGLRNTLYLQGSSPEFFLQPRARLSYALFEDLSLQATYDHIAQNIHLLTNSSLGQPVDLWLPATEQAPTELSHQYNLSAQKTFAGFQLSLSAYYKDIFNVIEYKEGASVVYGISEGWQDKISTGNGTSKGIELLISKTAGKLSGHIAYTLSRSTRQFTNINNGRVFPFKYDRTHDGNILLLYSLGKKSKLSALFNYNTGNAITLPVAKTSDPLLPGFEHTGYEKDIERLTSKDLITERNNARMPDYHRLDLSYSHSKEKKNKRVRTWVVSIYNAYNRLNPYFIYESEGKLKQYAFFPIIPSVAYNLEF